MPQNENSSFIPRRTAAASKRQRSRRTIGLFGYLSYIVFFVSLLVGAGVFFYYQYIQVQVSEKQEELNMVKNQFDQTEMNRVQEFESFLSAASRLYQSSIVTGRVFAAIEDSIADGAVFSSLAIERGANNLEVLAEVTADSFDTALFQRSVYDDFPLLSSFNLQNAVLANFRDDERSSDEGSLGIAGTPIQPGSELVRLTLVFDIPAAELSFSNLENPQGQTEMLEEVAPENTENSFDLTPDFEQVVSTTTDDQPDSAEGESEESVDEEEGVDVNNNDENI